MDAKWLEESVKRVAQEIVYETQAVTGDRLTIERYIVDFASKFSRKIQDSMLDSIDAVTKG